MTGRAQLRTRFERLLAQGWLPHSACSAALRTTLAPLLAAGVLTEERSGAGRRFVVRDANAARAALVSCFPTAELAADATSRVLGVGRFRNSKALPSTEPEIVCVRAWRPEALSCAGRPVTAAAATTDHGLFAFLLGPGRCYALHGPCALVENPAVFNALERLELGLGLAVYGHGRASDRLLDWLAGMSAPDFALQHLPDYDPVGLAEFERLRARLGPRVSLHLPADLAERFRRYSNRTLLEKPSTQTLLRRLRRSVDPSIQQVLALIDRHNAGLEQEALLLDSPPPR